MELFPRPRQMERLGDDGPPVTMTESAVTDASLESEGFVLEITQDAVRIRHRDDAGLRYARLALQQIRTLSAAPGARPDSQGGGRLPRLRIEDWPDFPVRGYMLDVSRDRVPTRESLERLVGQLALMRFNHLELYTEHTFAYTGHDLVWQAASPITPDDVRWLDALCAANGITLCANQNTFGHMARWLQHEPYRERAETPDGFTTRHGIQLSAATLAPTRENAEFAVGLCRELLSHHSHPTINIGCDETFELGRGRSADAVAARGKSRVFVEHLSRLIEPLNAEGHPVLFWGDMLRSHPELVRELPKGDNTALAWHYEAPNENASLPDSVRAVLTEMGIDMSEEQMRGFSGHVGAFEESGMPFWVCPGTSTWNTLIGRLPNARGNLLDAAETGLASGARGYLITDWGDNGHMQPPSISLAPLAYGAAVSWCAAKNRDLDPTAFLDRFVFDDSTGTIASVLARLGEIGEGTGKRAMNGSPLFTDLVGTGLLGSMGDPTPDGVTAVIEELDACRRALEQARPACPDGTDVVRELRQAARLARHGAFRIARAAGFDRPADPELARDLAEAIEEQRACWLLRSRPGGLDDSVARLEKAASDYTA